VVADGVSLGVGGGYRMVMGAHFEPYVQLVDVTDQAALIAWGGFWLGEHDGGWRAERAGETFGVRSEPRGRAVAEVIDGAGAIVGRTVTDEANHAWVHGLRPATTYRYRVLVDGEPWAGGKRLDWAPGTLGAAWRPLDQRLRTHAGGSEPDPVTFLALGDFGVGIASGADGARQLAVARTMQRLADAVDVRFVVGLGDSIYHGPGGPQDATGAYDEDWWLTFFQPYRYLWDHLAFYPTAGNHDSSDTEASDDREQLEDNLYLRIRFGPREESGRASIDPGLFYRLRVSALLELICVDTTWGAERGLHWFDEPGQRGWLERTLASSDAVWQVPFSHHPAYSAGPHHASMPEQLDRLVPLYRRNGVRLLLHGHEHNFQHGQVEELQYVVSGAGGKLDEQTPLRFEEAGTLSWAAVPHCLLVQVMPDHMIIIPYGPTPPGAEPIPIARRRPDGTVTHEPITIPLR
jgi:tartrate-resistant acid phosphatase type 5